MAFKLLYVRINIFRFPGRHALSSVSFQFPVPLPTLALRLRPRVLVRGLAGFSQDPTGQLFRRKKTRASSIELII